jgi:antitoxin (DNA-binding transcriptional repressor) of toxin-antitoxin stability system
MEKANVTLMARNFSKFLGKVKRGASIQVVKRGHVVARLVPDCDFMEGVRAAALFRDHTADPAVGEAIAAEVAKLTHEADDALHH